MEMKSKYRKAIFIVTYCLDSGKIKYLILKRKLHWKGWEFPKGKIEKGESKEKAARCEAREETGLKIIKIKKFNVSGKYLYSKKLPDRPGLIGQTYSLYAVEVKKGKVSLDKVEHSGYKWLAFKEAFKKLSWKNQRECLKIVDKSLVK